MCERHGECARYAAINGAQIPSETWLAYCSDGQGGRPLFIATLPTLDYAEPEPDLASVR